MGSEIRGAYIIMVNSAICGDPYREARRKMSPPFSEIEPQGWYDNETTLNVYLNEIQKQPRKRKNLREVGRNFFSTMRIISPEVINAYDNAIDLMKNIRECHHASSRGDIGEFIVESVTDNSATIKENSVHDTNFVQGVLEGLFDLYDSHKLLKCKIVKRKEKDGPYSIIELEFKRLR